MAFSVVNIDISQYPSLASSPLVKSGEELTLGDLHANPLSLLWILNHTGIIAGIETEEYQTLYQIYMTDTKALTRERIAQYKALLDKIEIIIPDVFLRLLGDCLADRGANDLFVLLLLQALGRKGLAFEIILSNHDLVFLRWYFCGSRTDETIVKQQVTSLVNLTTLIKNYIITIEEVIDLVDTAYLPYLKALSYHLEPNTPSLTLFSHAPIDLRLIRRIATLLNLGSDNLSRKSLMQVIDAYNLWLTSYRYLDLTIYRIPENDLYARGLSAPALKDLVWVHCWHRGIHNLVREKCMTTDNCAVMFCHGHNGHHIHSTATVINLNGSTGQPGRHVGSYALFRLPGHQLTAAASPKAQSLTDDENFDKQFNAALKKKNFNLLLKLTSDPRCCKHIMPLLIAIAGYLDRRDHLAFIKLLCAYREDKQVSKALGKYALKVAEANLWSVVEHIYREGTSYPPHYAVGDEDGCTVAHLALINDQHEVFKLALRFTNPYSEEYEFGSIWGLAELMADTKAQNIIIEQYPRTAKSGHFAQSSRRHPKQRISREEEEAPPPTPSKLSGST